MPIITTQVIVGAAIVIAAMGVKIVRPIEKGLIETLGKYSKTAEQGFHWIIPFIQSMRKVNITEQMVDVPPQTIQTSDKLNMTVDAMVYYKVKNVMSAEYNVTNHRAQLTSLARTTLRAVMGNMNLTSCIKERAKINEQVESILAKETDNYGVEVLRVEVQKIEPPASVVASMNEVVMAEQEKIAAVDRATAAETVADGEKKAAIKKAEGISEAKMKIADGEAYKIEKVNTAAIKFFKEGAVKLKELQVTQASLEKNTKIVLTEKGIKPVIVLGDVDKTVIPIPQE